MPTFGFDVTWKVTGSEYAIESIRSVLTNCCMQKYRPTVPPGIVRWYAKTPEPAPAALTVCAELPLVHVAGLFVLVKLVVTPRLSTCSWVKIPPPR